MTMPKRYEPSYPENKEQLTVLDQFLQDSQSIDTLSAENKHDIYKVVECLKFIKINLEFIAYCVDNALDASVFNSEEDMKKGVIRDFNGTSMHIFTYHSGDQAKRDLTRLIEQFESAVAAMREKKMLPSFCRVIQYDEAVGCIEKRVSACLTFAAKVMNSEAIDFDLKMADFISTQNGKTNLELSANAYWYFQSLINLPGNYKKSVVNGKKVLTEDVTEIISFELVRGYLSNIMGIELSSEEQAQLNYKIYEHFLSDHGKPDICLNSNQMLQHSFDNERNAQAFIEWLKRHEHRKLLNAERLKICKDQKENKFIVNISFKQYKLVVGPVEAAEKFEVKKNIDSEDKIVEKFSQCKNQPDLLLEMVNCLSSELVSKTVLRAVQNSNSYLPLPDPVYVSFLEIINQKVILTDVLNKLDKKILNEIVSTDDYFLTEIVKNVDEETYRKFVSSLTESTLSRKIAKDFLFLPEMIEHQAKAFLDILPGLSDKQLYDASSPREFKSILPLPIFLLTSLTGIGLLSLRVIKKPSLLKNAFVLKDKETFVRLLEKMSPKTIERNFVNIGSRTRKKIFSFCVSESNNPERSIILLKSLKALQKDQVMLARAFSENYFSDKSYPAIVNKHLANFVLAGLNQVKQLSPNEKILKQYLEKLSYSYQFVDPNRNEDFIITSLGNKITFNDPKLEEKIWEEGLLSISEYHKIKHCDNTAVWNMVTHLSRAELLFSGAGKNNLLEQARDLSETVIVKGRGLVKIVKKQDKEKFFKQLHDPSYRADLRKSVSDATHKFVHLTGKIIDYKKESKSNKKYTHTKKTSTTHISKKLHTPVFGHQHDKRELVGFIFNRDSSKVKALLKRDVGTYMHQWLGSNNDVMSYAEYVKPFNCISEKEFEAAIDNEKAGVNEVLAELSSEAIEAVVIAKDTKEARELAINYANEIKKRFGKTVPILFYDNNNRMVTEYTAREQKNDILSRKHKTHYNYYREGASKNNLLELKSALEGGAPISGVGFFQSSKIKRIQADPEAKKEISEEIKRIEKAAEHNDEFSWTEAEEKIVNLCKAFK